MTDPNALTTFISTGDESYAPLSADEEIVLARCRAASTRANALNVLAFAYTDGRVSTTRVHEMRRIVVAHFGGAS